MALGSVNGGDSLTSTRSHGNKRVTPVSLASDWVELLSALHVADNSGNAVVNPGALSREAIKVLKLAGQGTALELCVQYISGEAWTDVTLQLFGFDSGKSLGNGTPLFDGAKCRPHKLFDADDTHELVFSDVSASDVRLTITGPATYNFTAIQTVDCRGATFVMPTVKTAATGAGSANLRLLGRLL